MDQPIIYQLKLAALQAAAGDVDKAESLYQWLTKEAQEAEAKVAQAKADAIAAQAAKTEAEFLAI